MLTTGLVLATLITGYIIGVAQGGIHINISNSHAPLAPKEGEERKYNEDYSHMLPPDVQDFLLKNNGQIK